MSLFKHFHNQFSCLECMALVERGKIGNSLRDDRLRKAEAQNRELRGQLKFLYQIISAIFGHEIKEKS